MVSRQEIMKYILQKNLDPSFLEIDNKSENHIGHSGHNGKGESHYNIRISSPKLKDMSLLVQHRTINDLLKEEFASGLHAVSIKII